MTGGSVSHRFAVDELGSARPMATSLPAVFQDDDFTQRWLSAFDQVVAPIETVIDCFPAYLDADLAPDDFVAWIGSWLGADFDVELPDPQRRALVRSLVDLYARRGTVGGIRELVELQLPARCEVIEGGGAQASSAPGAPLPGSDAGAFVVRIAATAGPLSDHQRRRAAMMVEASRPAHLPVVIEFP